MNYTCIMCQQPKSKICFYNSKRNRRGVEHICIECRSIKSAMHRYKVCKQIIIQLYSKTKCECCGSKFMDKKLRHIHHVENTIRGIICFACNLILGQESNIDRDRIDSCLNFISCNNLLHTVNPQERPNSMAAVPESSETTRCETLYCKQCMRSNLTQNDFHKTGKSRRPRRICRSCWNSSWRLRNKHKAERESAIKCHCCQYKFTKKNKSCVHHIGDVIYGIICNRCNTILGNESIDRVIQLQSCLEFMI